MAHPGLGTVGPLPRTHPLPLAAKHRLIEMMPRLPPCEESHGFLHAAESKESFLLGRRFQRTPVTGWKRPTQVRARKIARVGASETAQKRGVVTLVDDGVI